MTQQFQYNHWALGAAERRPSALPPSSFLWMPNVRRLTFWSIFRMTNHRLHSERSQDLFWMSILFFSPKIVGSKAFFIELPRRGNPHSLIRVGNAFHYRETSLVLPIPTFTDFPSITRNQFFGKSPYSIAFHSLKHNRNVGIDYTMMNRIIMLRKRRLKLNIQFTIFVKTFEMQL